jgi:hypothetical protein
MANNFYIVPPRLIVGSLQGNNNVTSLNNFRGDVNIVTESPLTLLRQFNNVILGFDSTGFITTAGGTITGNLNFNVSAATTYGVQLLSKTVDPSGTPPQGAIYYNTATQTIRIYDGGWTDYTGTGSTVNYDTFYLRLDGSNQPVTGYVAFDEYIRVANKFGVQASFGSSYGAIYYDTSVNKLRVYTPSGWSLVGSGAGGGITGIYSGSGISFIPATSPITDTGTITVDESYSFTWTGNQSFTQPISFAANQTFDITKLSITSQAAGDVLYYNGTNWTRLGIGNTGEVLTVATGATKPEWSPSAASGTLGTPTDTTYTDGYFDTWTPGVTTTADAFDDINELLALLAPSSPSGLNGSTLSAVSAPTFYTAKVSAGLSAASDNWYQAGITTGSTLTKYYVSGSYTLASSPSSIFFAGKAGDTASFGTVSHILYNSTYTSGTAVSFVDLTTNPTPTYTLGTMRITALGTTNTIWNKANAQIYAYTQSGEGYAGNTLEWSPSSIGSTSETNKYEVWKDTYSASNANPSFASGPSNSVITENFKWLSGIPYYTTGTNWHVEFVAASGIFNRCYNATRVANISATGLNTISLTGDESGTPVYSATYDRSSSNYVSVTLNASNQSSFNKYLTVGLYKVVGSTSSNTAINYYINTYGNVSTSKIEYFQDEVFRLVNDSSGTGTSFDSTANLLNSNAQVRSGTLRVPVQAEYTAQWGGSAIDYSGDTIFEYQRYFSHTSPSPTKSGTLAFSGITATDIYAYGSSGSGSTGLNLLIYLETDAVWFDMGVPVGLGGDGSTKSLAIGAKDIANTSGSNLAWSLGSSYSTALNNNRYRLSIIFNKNSTKTITQVTSS